MGVLDTLRERGFVKQTTDETALRRALDSGPLTFYLGVDPSGPSIHAGHLFPVLAMYWLQQAGHHPILVLGGGTGRIGDPTGKDRVRDLLDDATVAENMLRQRRQYGRFLDLSKATVVDNADWLLPLHYIDFLRDIGKHFSVNRMLGAEGVRQRLDRDQGLSFIEFNYHLLQSYDFLVLHERYDCSLQIGGDDQWFNILGGVDLIRRVHAHEAHALTMPLLMTADGKKMGKTEAGALFLDATMVSPYAYFQYWLNVSDADVGKLLGIYTRLPIDEVRRLGALTGADLREAKRALAREATAWAHGPVESQKADEAAKAAFSGGASVDMPQVALPLPAPLVDVLVAAGLAASKSAARKLIEGGGVRIGDHPVLAQNVVVEEPAVVWAGKKRAVRVVAV